MKIRRMTASFGALEGRTLELGEGLNIINAPNESGKSTWCAFLRAMLYGVDTSEREKAGFKPDKVKYAPWSGAPMEGSMDLSCALGDITLQRWTKTAGAPMREFRAVFTGTDNPVPGLKGQTAGETLLGVPRAVFERSAFIRQSGLPVSGSPELEKRIAAIVSTGEEDSSFTEADARLRAWQRLRRHNKYGRLPETEQALRHVEDRLEALHEATDERAQLARELGQVQEKAARLGTELMAARDRRQREMTERLDALRAEAAERETALSDAGARLEKRRLNLAQDIFGEADPDQLQEDVLRDIQRAEALNDDLRPLSSIFWIMPLILCVAAFVAGFLLLQPLFIVSAVMLLAAILAFIKCRLSHRRAAKAAARRDELFQKYRAADGGDITAAFEAHRRSYAAWQEAIRARDRAQAALEESRGRRAALEQELLTEGAEIADLSRRLAEAELLGRRLSEEWAMSEGRLKAMGDPLVLETERRALADRLAELERQYDALGLAVETLRAAGAEIQNRFSPRLSRRATELMQFLTDGAYDELLLDKDFAARAKRAGDLTGRETVYLSEGAMNQLYLALRLAICELALPEADPCPLVLDDALVNFDDARCNRALMLLRELGRQRQILLFTCQQRESAFFRDIAKVHTEAR